MSSVLNRDDAYAFISYKAPVWRGQTFILAN